MDLESGRQMYFLGKLVKKAGRAIGKIVKSPVGKIGLGALAEAEGEEDIPIKGWDLYPLPILDI